MNAPTMPMPTMPQVVPQQPTMQGSPLANNPPQFQNVNGLNIPMPQQPVVAQSGMIPVGTPLPTSIPPVVPSVPTLTQHPPKTFEQILAECTALAASTPIRVSKLMATRELAAAFWDRNKKNRFLKASIYNDYKHKMLTNLVDDKGEPLFGITEWNWSLPVIVFMDSTDSVHNGQHCLKAWNDALTELENSATGKKVGDESKAPVDYAKLGITPESLKMQIVLVWGIDPNAADYIDTARRRTTGDIAFRNRDVIFKGLDYSKLAKDGVIDPAKLESVQNQESTALATALKIIAYRRWYKGEFIRGGSKGGTKFEGAPFNAAFAEFPGVARSVHEVYLMNLEKPFKEGLKHVNISLPYLMASHYLATMAFAVPMPMVDQSTGQPIPGRITFGFSSDQHREQVIAYANSFITMVVTGDQTGDQTGQYQWITQLRDMFAADPKDDANANNPLKFDRSNFGLSRIFNALGWAFRNFAISPAEQIPHSNLKLAGNYALYGDGSGFDPRVQDVASKPGQPATAAA